ncbi:hypothetical protein Pyn_16615 [Prunus yedoensis var. nudiflora]|uniref:Uncharacterized protein n=1 Tax=Prunus yedoensis var. nudiflora TaxID=2094558 RepID=A0A314U761_PRUYE|nr:hypothetical protein Pyn_16615 [Prunus yedoensis var. nudiflora]
MTLRRGYSWFKKRLVYQGPKGVDDPMASKNMDIFLCLQSRDLPCDGSMDTINYQCGVEAYNPQFFSRQLGCPWVIPELNYSLINKGSSYRFPKLSREDLLGIRAKYADSAQALELKPSQPDCSCTQSFQSWWSHYHGKFRAIETAYKRVFEGCPFRRELSKKDSFYQLPDFLSSQPIGGSGKQRRGPLFLLQLRLSALQGLMSQKLLFHLFLLLQLINQALRRGLCQKSPRVGGGSQIQPEVTQGKRAWTFPMEVLETSHIAPQVPIPSSPPMASIPIVETLRYGTVMCTTL